MRAGCRTTAAVTARIQLALAAHLGPGEVAFDCHSTSESAASLPCASWLTAAPHECCCRPARLHPAPCLLWCAAPLQTPPAAAAAAAAAAMSSSDDEDAPGSSAAGAAADDAQASLPALFWDRMPDNPEEHPDFLAMQALAEESSPEERAENFKTQGNNKLRVGLKAKNRLLLREAVEFYDKGLALKCSDKQLIVALHNNRAHVNSLLGNWRSALQDSRAALALDPGSIKAVFRGARAALRLREWEACRSLLEAGLALEPDAAELHEMQQELAAARAQHEHQQAAAAAAQDAALAPARRLAAALALRGYRLTSPQVHVGSRRPYVSAADGSVHWPVLLMYPETGQQDVIEDADEDDLVADHLDVMFGPSAPPLEWDAQGEYSREAVQLYYLSNAGPPLQQEQLVQAMHGQWPELPADAGPRRYGPGASHWVAVDEAASLRQVLLAPDHVVPGVPLFWVVAKGTDYARRFLAEELRR